MAANRAEREAAIKELNSIAADFSVDPIALRSKQSEIEAFFKKVCSSITADRVDEVIAAREKYINAGGQGDLPTDALAKLQRAAGEAEADVDGHVPSHKKLTQSLYAKTPFRLHAKAFMLTFNAIAFTVCAKLWDSFQAWAVERAKTFAACSWSCTMEKSLNAAEAGRVHLHCYFSWQSAGSQGIDHRTTDEWVFNGVRPRVDSNSERRGPHEWLRATQHGHFYVSVHKKGTLYSDTNYAPWNDNWIPEAWWVVSLWKQHKLDYDDYMVLSLKLRDHHDKRKAVADAVLAGKTRLAFREEQRRAFEMIAAVSKPMKPLPAEIEAPPRSSADRAAAA